MIVKALLNVNGGGPFWKVTTTVCVPVVAFAGIVKFATTVPWVV